jgi:hypothetical protein
MKQHAIKTCRDVDGDGWSASRPGRFISEETAPGTRSIGGWVGPRVGLSVALAGE